MEFIAFFFFIEKLLFQNNNKVVTDRMKVNPATQDAQNIVVRIIWYKINGSKWEEVQIGTCMVNVTKDCENIQIPFEL